MIKKVLKRKLLPAITLSLLIILSSFIIDVDGWNQQAYIYKFNKLEIPASQDLMVIEIDNESIKHFNTWPWPRSRFAEFLIKVEEASPKMVAFDIDFSTKSHDVFDAEFSKALENVSFPVILPSTTEASHNVMNLQQVERRPIKSLSKYSLLGHNKLLLDDSGKVFKYPTFSVLGRPSIGALMANKANTPDAPILINYSIDPKSIPRLSFKDIATNKFDYSQIEGKTLLIGFTSSEMGDLYNLPKHGRTPSVLIHALGYETLVSDKQFTAIPDLVILILSVIMFICVTFTHDDKRLVLALGFNCLFGGIIYIISFLLHNNLMIMLPVAMLYVALIASCLLQVIQNIKYRTYILFKETNRNNYNKALVNQVIKESANGIVITDLQGAVLVANQKARQLFSMDHDTIINGESVYNYIPHSEDLLKRLSQSKPNSDSKIDFSVKKISNKHGQEFSIEMILNKTNFVQHIRQTQLIGRSQKVKSHEIFSFTISDVTEKMKIIAEKTLSENALIDLKNNDQLTKLPNRNSFNKILDLLYSNTHVNKSSLVILVNLDSLKEINDIYGVYIGDDAICQVGNLINSLIDDHGIVARFSDKIFGIIYNDIDTENTSHCEQLLSQIHYLFAKPLNLHGQKVIMDISMGVVIAPKHGETPDILMNNATQALDYSKSSNDIKWFTYEEDLTQTMRSKRSIRLELERAIENDEFVLYYQPQHEILTGKLIGFESLIRWEDPEKGLRFPDEFIPVAEDCDLITKIGEMVLKIGCEDAVNWPDDISVAINVSPIQFKNTDMAALCKRYIYETGLPAHRLELEITESMMMDDIDHVIRTLTKIQDLGVKIAMDDFGTGYSSLQYLTELPFDKIKIDRSFTMNIGKSKQADALISTIVALGHSLDKMVLAEGIETEDMIILLKAAGCHIGQGYHYSRPMPIEDVRNYFESIEMIAKTA